MLSIFVLCLCLHLFVLLHNFIINLNLKDDLYAAFLIQEARQEVHPFTTVKVRNLNGNVYVLPSSTRQVDVVLRSLAVTKISQDAANAACKKVALDLDYKKDCLEVLTALPATLSTRLDADLTIRVPSFVSIDLFVKEGNVMVGSGYDPSGQLTTEPIRLESIKVRHRGQNHGVSICMPVSNNIDSKESFAISKIDIESEEGWISYRRQTPESER